MAVTSMHMMYRDIIFFMKRKLSFIKIIGFFYADRTLIEVTPPSIAGTIPAAQCRR